MADEDEGQGGDESHERRECMPCRGTGRVISNLGGSPAHVPCPWCEGSGRRVPGIDAQAGWLEQSGASSDRPEAQVDQSEF